MNETLSPLDAAELTIRSRVTRARKAADKVVETRTDDFNHILVRASEGASKKTFRGKTVEARERLAALALALICIEKASES